MTALQETGYIRLPQVLKYIPVSKSTWWAGVKSGRFPKSVKLSIGITAWRASDIHDYLNKTDHLHTRIDTSKRS